MKLLSKNPKEALPYKYYFFPTLILTLAGIGDTIYLALSHYRNYTDISYASFCAISRAINCDTVSQSPWSILLGIPVAYWGLTGYLIFLAILLPTWNNSKTVRPLWSILFILALLYTLSAMFFGYISAQKIHSYCIMCILSYAISFSLLLYSWIIRRRFCTFSLWTNLKKSFSLLLQNIFLKFSLAVIFLGVLSLQLFLPPYWQYHFSQTDQILSSGVNTHGHPWIGAEYPELTIEEFTDYQCFQCAKMHQYLRSLVAEYPEKVRLVHRNYPMDHEVNPILVPEPFHVGSARLALLAIAAQSQDKFWQVNDLIFKKIRQGISEIDIKEIAQEAQADPIALAEAFHSKQTLKKLEKDIRAGLRHKITGTPAYVFNGEVYLGNLPESVFDILKSSDKNPDASMDRK